MNTCERALLRCLAADGGWVSRGALDDAAGFSAGRVDDELADMVSRGQISFNARTAQYRLVAGPLARRAAARLLAGSSRVQVLGMPTADKGALQLGVALHTADGLLLAEIEAPADMSTPGGLQQVATAMAQWARAIDAQPVNEPA